MISRIRLKKAVVGTSLTAQVGSVTVTGLIPAIVAGVILSASLGSVSITGETPTMDL